MFASFAPSSGIQGWAAGPPAQKMTYSQQEFIRADSLLLLLLMYLVAITSSHLVISDSASSSA
jgi:hypothetical protein